MRYSLSIFNTKYLEKKERLISFLTVPELRVITVCKKNCDCKYCENGASKWNQQQQFSKNLTCSNRQEQTGEQWQAKFRYHDSSRFKHTKSSNKTHGKQLENKKKVCYKNQQKKTVDIIYYIKVHII